MANERKSVFVYKDACMYMCACVLGRSLNGIDKIDGKETLH